MGIIAEALIKALTDSLNSTGINTKTNKPKNETILIDETRSQVLAVIEPDVELMPGWAISVLEVDIHIRSKGDPEDERFPIQEITIPFADPNAISKTVDIVKVMPIMDSSSHIGVILMEVPDEDIEDESKWTFTVVSGSTVETDDNGVQKIIESDVFLKGAKIEPHKST